MKINTERKKTDTIDRRFYILPYHLTIIRRARMKSKLFFYNNDVLRHYIERFEAEYGIKFAEFNVGDLTSVQLKIPEPSEVFLKDIAAYFTSIHEAVRFIIMFYYLRGELDANKNIGSQPIKSGSN